MITFMLWPVLVIVGVYLALIETEAERVADRLDDSTKYVEKLHAWVSLPTTAVQNIRKNTRSAGVIVIVTLMVSVVSLALEEVKRPSHTITSSGEPGEKPTTWVQDWLVSKKEACLSSQVKEDCTIYNSWVAFKEAKIDGLVREHTLKILRDQGIDI